MSHDPFGNLEEWSRVLVTLKDVSEHGALDEAQPGIVRLIRHHHNWRVRESALTAARQIREPTPTLINALIQVTEDTGTFVDARILAARALGDLAGRKGRSDGTPTVTVPMVRTVLRRLLGSPEAPVLTRAIEAALLKLEGPRPAA